MEKKDKTPKKDGRALPQYAPDTEAEKPLKVASPTALAEPETSAALLDVAAEILLQLATPNERLLAGRSPMPLATAAAFLREFCREMENVQVEVPTDALPAVSACMHNLFFCIGTAIHYAVAHVDTVYVRTGLTETEGLIYLEATAPAASRAEALACFGLSPERLFILQRIAKDGGFSFDTVAGERAMLVFTLPRALPRSVTLRANEDITLRAAFALPKIYFTN